jgi:hypothetical protein
VPDTVETLILDLLEWIGPKPRAYREVLDAWRTSCPRLPVWEDANDRGFITRHVGLVTVSPRGSEYLRVHRRPAPSGTGRTLESRACATGATRDPGEGRPSPNLAP